MLVTGAGGMLGRDAVAAARAAGHEVTPLTRAELDVADAAAVRSAFEGSRPEVVLNCAAYTNVDGAEDDEPDAMRVNGEGAGNVASAAAAIDAEVVYPSTDYVFDGDKREPYLESDPVAPRSAYGRSKLAGERATVAANPHHHVVRTSWLFGLAGKNFVETMLRVGRERADVSVVSDQVGCPTYTAHLAPALVALAGSDRFGVRHIAARGECSWFDFAEAIFGRAGIACAVNPTTTAEFARAAPRPAYSVLRSERLEATELPHWREGLDAYLTERSERVAA